MKITKEIIEKIEGEASLEVEWQDDKISFAKIKFLNYRGIENILEGRPFLDALAITPRVCGICSTSHVITSISAIENAYENFGYNLSIPQKAKDIREIVLNVEKIQNHIKWFYFNIYPEIMKFKDNNKYAFDDQEWKKAQKAIIQVLKVAAIFCGRWPHASFCMVGGVTCDPIQNDINDALIYLDEVTTFCENEIFGTTLEEYLSYNLAIQIMGNSCILSRVVQLLNDFGFNLYGKSYDRFIALGESYMYNQGQKCNGTIIANVDYRFVSESLENSFFSQNGYTYSKSAIYKERYFETGPIARLMIAKDPLIRDFHRRTKDSTLTRIVARVSEIAHLLQRTKTLLENLNLKESSCNSPKLNYQDITSEGVGIVEAARGSLMHTMEIKKGLIKSYDIITPTVWNLGNGTVKNPAIAQKAIIGLDEMKKADFVFKSFDICSVCTTQ